MPSYLISLRLYLGSAEKTSTRLVQAISEAQAKRIALVDECHNNCELAADGLSCSDMSGDFTYKVEKTKKLSPEQVITYKEIMDFDESLLLDIKVVSAAPSI